jgi:hypothetical protein
MRRELLGLVLFGIASAGTLQAQTPTSAPGSAATSSPAPGLPLLPAPQAAPSMAGPAAPPAFIPGPPPPFFGGDYDVWGRHPSEPPRAIAPLIPPEALDPPPPPRAGRIWFTSEYLLWFVRSDPSRFPLVTTDTNPGTLLAGSSASPTTVPLAGGSNFDYHAFSGVRLGIGGWFDAEHTIGMDVTGFFLFRRTTGLTIASDNSGNPGLYIPAYNLTLGREDSLVVADPALGFAGGVSVSSSLSLSGFQINGLYGLYHSESWNVNLLGGFRYLDLLESLGMTNVSTDLATGTTTAIGDLFETRNQFYGFALGTQILYTAGRFNAGLNAQVSLGNTHELVNIMGTTISGGTTTPGGFFAQPSNIGRHLRNSFTAIPELGVKVGYRITPGITLFAGYDLLEWSSVARAGDQIDRVLNLTQNPVLGGTGGTLVGAARPTTLFNRSDFFAQGLTLGVEWKY